MFGTKAVAAVTRSVMALTLASGLVVGTTQPAAASTMTEATMVCTEGTESVYFGLPLTGSARMSIFAYRVDGGSWAYTNWYYTSNGSYWMYDGGRWAALPVDSSMTIRSVGNRKLVEGFEYRYNPSTGAASWISLGSCRTTSYFDGGIVFN
jgi:hypothetical protein